ncbi:oxidoreductase [Streptomyces rubellomurinus]|uniref:3-ketoacyl-ACP reductase n=1 Tax=Streptomyces rubellomurinus (strain ATCC 31215) TaxID=359131 RepID=A0A0F2TA47_STRR3|nr:oxidoreductase [Streptomyces rubellomurinus]KJS59185.1 3-ketoacyl-ACP reductase [Streptomyces rubellomurinus]
MTEQQETTGRVWLITGANSGFGQAVAEAALAAGDTVVAAARRPETLSGLAAAHPGRVVPVRLDVTDQAQIAAAVDETLARFGRVDVLVNNAGRGLIGAVEESTDRELRDLMELHFFGPAALTRAVLPHMRARGSGAVVQMSSMGGRFSFPGVGAYSATKFALEGLSEALAKEVAGFGIKVLIVEPGAFRTGFAGGGALAHSAPIGAYDPIVGPVRTGLPDSDGKQPGDPVKAAEAILAALAAEPTPLRLALGSDAVDGVLANLDGAREELGAWEAVGRGTDFPAGA